jgi:hypothetical protein
MHPFAALCDGAPEDAYQQNETSVRHGSSRRAEWIDSQSEPVRALGPEPARAIGAPHHVEDVARRHDQDCKYIC